MAYLRAGDAGLDVTQSNIRAYQYLTITEQTSTTLAADFRAIGEPGYVVRFNGTGLGGSIEDGRVTGTLTELRETLDGALVFELSGVAVPAQTLLGLIASGNDTGAASLVLGGDDVVQGGAGNDVLRAFRGNNVFLGGGGEDAVLIDAPRAATLSYRYGDEAVVFRRTDRQADLLAGVETVRFRDGAVSQAALTAAQPFQYLATYHDLAAAFGTDATAGWRHFAQSGLAEGRAVGFSGLRYVASYGDLRATYGANAEAGAQHYLAAGRAEGRTASFDGLRYLASHGDLIRVLPKTLDAGALHFITDGAREGRTTTFDPLRYIASHRDLIRAFGANEARGVEHYLASGFAEGRPTTAFNPTQYLANYADVRAAFRSDLQAATRRYVQFGAAEGRVFTPTA